MAFDPKRHVIKVQGGREYLPVSARLIWFRQEHPDWGIVTSPIEINLKERYAIFSAQIFNAEGKLMASATKMEDVRGFADYLEKAETGAVGRALALCGYGTQFAPELEENSRMADSPYPMGGGGNRYPGNMGTRQNGPGNGNGMRPPMANNRPAPMGGNGGGSGERPPMAAPRPAPVPASPIGDDPFTDGDEPETVPPPRPVASSPAPAPTRPAPTPPPAASGSGITRVREPEKEYTDPGGDDDEGEDPFADEEEPIPAPAAARPRPAATAAPVAAAPVAAGNSDTSVATNHCSVAGCTMVLTPSQLTMSLKKYGKPVCLLHQKDMAPATAGSGAGRRGGEQAETLL